MTTNTDTDSKGEWIYAELWKNTEKYNMIEALFFSVAYRMIPVNYTLSYEFYEKITSIPRQRIIGIIDKFSNKENGLLHTEIDLSGQIAKMEFVESFRILYPSDGFLIPRYLLDHRELNLLQSALMSQIVGLQYTSLKRYGQAVCTASDHYLRNKLALSQETLSKTLKILEEREYIKTPYGIPRKIECNRIIFENCKDSFGEDEIKTRF